jgi:hypothetical protein
MAAPKKALYHSELVKNTPVTIKIKSDVTQSKFAGQPNYVIVEFQGHERNLSCENPEIESTLEGLKGRTLVFDVGGGGKNDPDSAYMQFVSESEDLPDEEPPRQPARRTPPPQRVATPARPVTPQAQPPARAAAPPAAPQKDPVLETKKMAARLVNLRLIAMQAALFFRDQVKEQFGVDQSPELTHATATTFMIGLEKASFVHQMPTGALKLAAAPAYEPSDNDGNAE